jgi:ACR3 family arsenite efflux pump ArsB
MGLFTKLQAVFIIFAAFLGIALGKACVKIEQNAGGTVEIFLMAMLFFTFLGVDIKRISGSFKDLRFSVSALLVNFLWTPVFAFLLAKMFFPEQAALQTGFIMLMVTPCTDWYLIFTGLANGNVTLGASILPLNLILQVLLLPAYLLIFMGRALSFDIKMIVKSIVFVLVIPLMSSNIIKFVVRKTKTEKIFYRITEKNDGIQFILLCLAIISMFASQGSVLLANLNIFIKLLFPLIIFFVVNFFLSLSAGKKLKLPFQNIISLIFTTSARNSPVALTMAVVTFPSEPLISLVLVMGPLIELPVLALNSALLKNYRVT